MKRIIITLLGAAALLSLNSCSKFLDQKPVSSIITEYFWQSPADAVSSNAAMYYSFSKAMANGYFDWGELRGGNWEIYAGRSTAKYQEIINYQTSSLNDACYWTNLYQTINRANLIIKYVSNISKLTPAETNQYLAEAYAMRALCYFYIVRVWGDAPLFYDPVESFDLENVYRSRVDRKVILNGIMEDLGIAEMLFPSLTSSYSTVTTHMNIATVYAMKMDVLAWRHDDGDYQMVADIYENQLQPLLNTSIGQINWGFDPVITVNPPLNQADFLTAYRGMFSKVSPVTPARSKEIYFEVNYNWLENGENNMCLYFSANSGRRLNPTGFADPPTAPACIKPEQYIFLTYEMNDSRRAATYDLGKGQLLKFWPVGTDWTTTPKSEARLVIYRHADVVLLYAEALNERLRHDEALYFVNQIRQRASLPLLQSSDFLDKQTEIRDAILNERRRELVGEGKYWFDLVRTGNAIKLGGCPDENHYLFPIHQDHLVQNPNLTQNIF